MTDQIKTLTTKELIKILESMPDVKINYLSETYIYRVYYDESENELVFCGM